MNKNIENDGPRRYPNYWVDSPFRDPRFRLFPEVTQAMREAGLFACSAEYAAQDGFDLDQTHVIKPLALAEIFRKAADEIEAHTFTDVGP